MSGDRRPIFKTLCDKHALSYAQVASEAELPEAIGRHLYEHHPMFVSDIDALLAALSRMTGEQWNRRTVQVPPFLLNRPTETAQIP